MDGASAAATILQIIQTGITVSKALHDYGTSVINAKKSCKRLMDEISTISRLANTAEQFVRGLASSNPPESFCQFWIAPDSPAMRYKKSLDELMTTLPRNGGTQMKMRQRLTWHWTESKINSTIEAFERYVPYLEISIAMINK